MKISTTSSLVVFLLFLFTAPMALAYQREQITLRQDSGTTAQSAVFAAFLSAVNGGRDGDVALSVSNLLSAPGGDAFASLFVDGKNDRVGGLAIYLFSRGCPPEGGACEPEVYGFRTEDDPTVGTGADGSGLLAPGATYTVLLSELIRAIFGEDRDFSGYAWVVADFDAVGGSYTNFFPLINSGHSAVLGVPSGGLPVDVPAGK